MELENLKMEQLERERESERREKFKALADEQRQQVMELKEREKEAEYLRTEELKLIENDRQLHEAVGFFKTVFMPCIVPLIIAYHHSFRQYSL